MKIEENRCAAYPPSQHEGIMKYAFLILGEIFKVFSAIVQAQGAVQLTLYL